MGKEIKGDKDSSRKSVLKLIGLAGAIPIISACGERIYPISTQLTPENNVPPSSNKHPNPTDKATPTLTPKPS